MILNPVDAECSYIGYRHVLTVKKPFDLEWCSINYRLGKIIHAIRDIYA